MSHQRFGTLPAGHTHPRGTGGGYFRTGGSHSPQSLKTRIRRRHALILQLRSRGYHSNLWDMSTHDLLRLARESRRTRVRRSR